MTWGFRRWSPDNGLGTTKPWDVFEARRRAEQQTSKSCLIKERSCIYMKSRSAGNIVTIPYFANSYSILQHWPAFNLRAYSILIVKMLSKSLIALGTGAALVAGITPSGFTPASNVDLMVVYAQTAATNGVLVAKDSESRVE